jgi:uncharacterized Tic20 family protein
MSNAFENPYAKRSEMTPENQRMWSIAIHLGTFISSFIVPLVAYLVFKDSGAFVSHHARNSLNFNLSIFLYTGVLLVSVIGVVLIPVVAVIWVVLTVVAALRASRGEFYEIPLAIRFIRPTI